MEKKKLSKSYKEVKNMKKYIPPRSNETKADSFKRIVNRRVKNILHSMNSLSNCANINNYFYTEKQVKKIFDVLQNEIEKIEKSFEEHKVPTFNL